MIWNKSYVTIKLKLSPGTWYVHESSGSMAGSTLAVLGETKKAGGTCTTEIA